MSAPTRAGTRDRAAAIIAAHTGNPDQANAIADQLAADGLLAPEPAPAAVCRTPVVVRPPSKIEQTIARRTTRQSCSWPAKAAYNPDVPAEMAVIERRRGPGMKLYPCGCGWHHLGHPAQDDRPEPPPLPDGSPIVWARERRRVVLVNGAGQPQSEGVAESYCDSPTLRVRVNGQLVTWVADLARPAPS